MTRVRLTCIISLLTTLSGCAAFLGFNEDLNQYEQQLINHNCDYTPIDAQIKSDPLLWTLNGGALARQCSDYKKSIEYLDQAEAIFKQQETALEINSIGHSVASILVNNNINDYQGENYEKIMMNVYKGLNFMSLNDFDYARVEFNRVLDRQRRATEFFEKEIDNAYNQYNQSEYMREICQPVAENTKISRYNGDITPEMIYPNFVNPFATYISALFFYLDKDYSKARDLFKQTTRMLPNQQQVQADLKLAEQGAQTKQHYAWLIYENGQGMIKRSFTYRFPAYLFTDKVVTSDVSLPTIYKRSVSYPYLKLNQTKTTEITNMDNIIQIEFSKKLPGIITEAMLNMVAKSAMQYTLEKNLEEYGGKLWGFLYQLATDTADVRQWRAMPKNFQIARVPMTDNRLTIYKPDGSILTQIDSLQPDRDAVIYIKSDLVDHNTIHIIQKSTNHND
ncbi:hypothetical protein DES39_1382 [Orbus hercynius]|uniref:Tetratricopeptide repeat protein n=2 Tax=Orbus hercynius TaxID=593135 RepID=A0A495RFC4_9GAMM|nr:hypothetical protein DES39_1382 [Orbus hercynius]